MVKNNNQVKKINLLAPYKKRTSLERRCSSHTFRYGYLVTT